MDLLVANRFGLKRKKILESLSVELDETKSEYSARGLGRSTRCAEKEYGLLYKSAEKIIDCLLESYLVAQETTGEAIIIRKEAEINDEIMRLVANEHSRIS